MIHSPPETPPTGDQTRRYISVVHGARKSPSSGHSHEPEREIDPVAEEPHRDDREARAEGGEEKQEATHQRQHLTRSRGRAGTISQSAPDDAELAEAVTGR